MKDIVVAINQLRAEAAELIQSGSGADEGVLDEKVKAWTRRTYEKLKGWGFTTEAEETFGRNSITWMYDGVTKRAKMRDDKLKALSDDISLHPEHYESRLTVLSATVPSVTRVSKLDKIFLGHGRNSLWARLHMHLKDELRLPVEAWESDARTGFHAIDVLKTTLASCTFAAIVATGDDETVEGAFRARQNVIHEVGLFQGRLGFEKVALLQQRSVEGFSNLAGLQVIPFNDRIEDTFYELDRMLRRERILK
jgi:predicted nucleotide-binding protein